MKIGNGRHQWRRVDHILHDSINVFLMLLRLSVGVVGAGRWILSMVQGPGALVALRQAERNETLPKQANGDHGLIRLSFGVLVTCFCDLINLGVSSSEACNCGIMPG